jgi:hypothetical protein
MKTAILRTFCGESPSHEIVEVEDDFCFDASDPCGDLVPFTVGSNQTIIEPPYSTELNDWLLFRMPDAFKALQYVSDMDAWYHAALTIWIEDGAPDHLKPLCES